MRISDWSSDVCSSDLDSYQAGTDVLKLAYEELGEIDFICCDNILLDPTAATDVRGHAVALETPAEIIAKKVFYRGWSLQPRSEEHTSELQSLMRISYAVFCLQKKKKIYEKTTELIK